jgi:hypothetical protein
MLVTSAEILALPQVWETYALLEPMQYSIDFRFQPLPQENPAHKSGLYPIARFWRSAILRQGLDLHMPSQSYDIFRRDAGGDPVWVEAVADLETAKGRIIELSAAAPGQYVVFSQRSGRMVSSGTVLASPAARATRKVFNCSEGTKSETLWK